MEDGSWEKSTKTWIVPKRIPIDANSPEVAEYIQIAKSRLTAQGDTVPEAAIQGNSIILTFNRPDGVDFYRIVTVDIKTKEILSAYP